MHSASDIGWTRFSPSVTPLNSVMLTEIFIDVWFRILKNTCINHCVAWKKLVTFSLIKWCCSKTLSITLAFKEGACTNFSGYLIRSLPSRGSSTSVPLYGAHSFYPTLAGCRADPSPMHSTIMQKTWDRRSASAVWGEEGNSMTCSELLDSIGSFV